ncbi:NAD(P)-binding protein [Hypoxylon sp. FL0543]|nr:NAD(P)-binding protein [Hypoxylon sp. FL0543]
MSAFAMTKVDNEIRGRLALITGASGGIGSACARDLWAQGASLALTCYHHRQPAVDLMDELLKSDDVGNRKITLHCVNIGWTEGVEQLFREIGDQHGKNGPDILVSNAGYGKRRNGIADVSLEEFDHTINVNLRASFILCKLSIPHMEAQRWGRIIFISSIAAQGGGINACHYAASKAGLTGLMKNLAMKHAKVGITVNDVAPAMIGETGMIPDKKSVEGTPGDVNNIPVGRLGTPQECANVVTMICKTGYLTGQSILLSGGLK